MNTRRSTRGSPGVFSAAVAPRRVHPDRDDDRYRHFLFGPDGNLLELDGDSAGVEDGTGSGRPLRRGRALRFGCSRIPWGSAQSFAANLPDYYFLAENGSEATLSFVARLSEFFPRSGKFGDLDVRRVTFSVESGPDGGNQLVLRQNPLVMESTPMKRSIPLCSPRT